MKPSIRRLLGVVGATGHEVGWKARGSVVRAMRAAGLGLCVLAMAAALSSPASAQTAPFCNEAITSAPSGPASVSAASTPYGRVLVVGSGPYTGCSLYVLTSDRLHALSGADYACSNNTNVIEKPCDTVLWPALLTKGAPIAGTGINPTLLGTVTRSDLFRGTSVQQVTYAGQPLYRFFLDEARGETEGANLFDPVTSPPGTWYLVDPSRGLPAPGTAQVQLETAPIGGTGPEDTVLAAVMNNDFRFFENASFPAYTLNTDGAHNSACEGECAAAHWQPVLTSQRPQAGPGVDEHALGIIVRSDGTHQVTYDDHPLYLFFGDAYIPGLIGTKGINGAGAHTPWGVFNTIPPS
jgi:predicted lipoprotein with Yx(FWY)xxD motif